MEIWKDIPGHEGKYQASNLGRIKSLDQLIHYKDGRHRPLKGKILSPGNPKRYKTVALGLGNSFDVHRLIAIVFCKGRSKERREVNHIDGNKHNNNCLNLEWVSRLENVEHAVKTGLARSPKGESTGSSVLCEKDIMHIRDEYFYCDGKRPIIKKLAKGHRVSTTTIHNIIKYNKWKHVR